MSAYGTPGGNHDRDRVLEFIRQIEVKEERIAEHKDDVKALYEAANAAGLDKKALRRLVKVRRQNREGKREQRENDQAAFEWLADTIGESHGVPLHRHFETLQRAGGGSVVDLMKSIVPEGGQIIVQEGGENWVIWRDASGHAHAEPHMQTRKRPGDAPDAQGSERGSSEQSQPAQTFEQEPEAPQITPAEAYDQGKLAAEAGVPLSENPHPALTAQRREWDRGWREQSGEDGMGPDTQEGEG